jgi:HEAT repeat protein
MARRIDEITSDLSQADDASQRLDAASELRDAGFAKRTSLEKRGSLATAAETDLQSHELDALHAALEDDDAAVRCAAAISAGDLGDASSVPALTEHLDDDDEAVRLAAIDSLGDIGGLDSMRALTRLACDREQPEEIRLAALTELEELAAKAITSGPDRRFDPPDAPERAAEGGRFETEDARAARSELLDALAAIQEDETADELLKLKAGDVLAYIESGVA